MTLRIFVPITVIAFGLVLTGPLSATRADVIISSGYYDLAPTSGSLPSLPNPWVGSPNTTFYGSTSDVTASTASDPDISGLLIQNTGATSVVLSALSLSFPLNVLARATTPNGNLPAGNVTLAPGQNYIFAVGDGSDTGLSDQMISLTLNGTSYSFSDATTALAPDGVLFGDNPQLAGGDETQPWTQDGTVTFGSSTIPEPASLAIWGMLLIGLGLAHHLRRRAAKA